MRLGHPEERPNTETERREREEMPGEVYGARVREAESALSGKEGELDDGAVEAGVPLR